jgi:hypothetical protein
MSPFSPTAAITYSDNKYAKRRSQMESLRIQYRNHASSQRFVLMLVATVVFSFLSFWVISNKMSANYAGSEEDVRSLQDLADSIRRVRIRRQQALNNAAPNSISNSGGSGSNDLAGNGLYDEGLHPQKNFHQTGSGGGGRQQQPMQLGGDGDDDEESLHHHHVHAHDDPYVNRPATSLHHNRPKYDDDRPLYGPRNYYHSSSDHGGDTREQKKQQQRFHPSDSERRWKSDVESQIDEESRLVLLENKIRSSHEINVQQEVQAKRFDDKMDATIEALKELSSHQHHHQHQYQKQKQQRQQQQHNHIDHPIQQHQIDNFGGDIDSNVQKSSSSVSDSLPLPSLTMQREQPNDRVVSDQKEEGGGESQFDLFSQEERH